MSLPRRLVLALCLCTFAAAAEAATLTITTNGTVSGAVSAIGPQGGPVCNPNPGGGAGGSCTFTYPDGTPLRLSANSPNTPGIFNSGTGDASACATSTCTFTLNTNSAITATFTSGDFRSIQINLTGVGKGNVGTNNTQCQNFELDSSVCTSWYGVGSVVTLQGNSVPGNIFEGFSGGTVDAVACASTPCVFTLNTNSSVNASFAALTSVAVTPGTASATVGGSSPSFTATGTFTNGATRSVSGLSMAFRQKRPMSAPRFGLAAGVVNNLYYAIGGVPSACVPGLCLGPLNTVEVYDPVFSGFGGIDNWTAKAPMVTPREGLAAAVLNGKLYALGGHTTGGGPVASIEAYDPGSNAWTLKAPMPTPRSGLAAAVINDVIYAVGGDAAVGGDPAMPLNTLEIYDTASDTWTTRSPMATARSGLAAAVVNGKLYAIGGDAAGSMEMYDPATDAWTAKAPIPGVGGEVKGGAIDGLIYVFHGFSGAVKVYNPATNTWAALGSMPTTRGEFGLAVLDGRFFIAGGLTATETSLAILESVRPPEATWWSSNQAVATINQSTRTATGVSLGTTTISALTVGVDSGAQSALLTVSTSGGGGNSQIFLGIPNSASTQVGGAQWGCGSFSSQNTTGTWSVTVNYGEAGGVSEPVPFILAPQPGDPCVFPGGGTPTGVFAFNHNYAAPGTYQVSVTVTRTGGTSPTSKTQSFPITVSEGNDGDGCAIISSNLVAGTVPFSTVHMSLFDRTSNELVFEADLPLGMFELGSAPAGLYRAEFSVPPGYVITPSQIAFDVICGQDLVLSASITPIPVVSDFSISANPGSLSLVQGTSGSSTISTAVTSGSAQAVSLTVSGVPSGATASLTPASVTAGSSSALAVNAGTAAAGTYTLSVTGTEGALTHAVTVTLTVTAAPQPDGRMFGSGFVADGGKHHHFAFRVLQRNQNDSGRFEYWVRTDGRGKDDDDEDDRDGDHDRDYGREHKKGMNRFEATTIARVNFSDDPAFGPGNGHHAPTVDTVLFAGVGKWNGVAGYTFEVRAVDRGEPGRNRDTVSVVITGPAGTVATIDGLLGGGNIQSTRLRR